MFNLIGLLRQGIFERLNEIPATGGKSSETDDRLALGEIIGHREHLAIRSKPMRGAFDQFVRRLAGA